MTREELDIAVSKEFFGEDYCPIATWVFCWSHRELWVEDWEDLKPEVLIFKNPGFATRKITEYFEECMSSDDFKGIEKLARLMRIAKSETPLGPKETRRHRIAVAVYRASFVSFPPFMSDCVRFMVADYPGDENAKNKAIRRFYKKHGFGNPRTESERTENKKNSP